MDGEPVPTRDKLIVHEIVDTIMHKVRMRARDRETVAWPMLLALHRLGLLRFHGPVTDPAESVEFLDATLPEARLLVDTAMSLKLRRQGGIRSVPCPRAHWHSSDTQLKTAEPTTIVFLEDLDRLEALVAAAEQRGWVNQRSSEEEDPTLKDNETPEERDARLDAFVERPDALAWYFSDKISSSSKPLSVAAGPVPSFAEEGVTEEEDRDMAKSQLSKGAHALLLVLRLRRLTQRGYVDNIVRVTQMILEADRQTAIGVLMELIRGGFLEAELKVDGTFHWGKVLLAPEDRALEVLRKRVLELYPSEVIRRIADMNSEERKELLAHITSDT